MIADDHSLVRKGLTQILELEQDIEVIAQADNGKDAVEKAMELNPDIVLMDINMPIQNGMVAIKQLKDRGCLSQIIVLTIHEDREYLLKSVKAGAAGYVMKDAEADNLIEAIRSVYIGETYIQPNITTKLIQDIDNDSYTSLIKDKFPKNTLTQRETEVLLHIAEGKNNREIADDLFISEKTVKNHISNIFKKIDVCDRTQAAIYVFKNRMI